MNMDCYQNPLCDRYASRAMQHIFSPDFKFTTWRKLWIILAKSQKELGLDFITDDMIAEMEQNISHIDYNAVNEYEKKFRHDVMAHIHHFGDLCPKARKIIHLGATSCFVGDNTDLIQAKSALELLEVKLANLINEMTAFADKYKNLPTLSYTHFQAAQLSTVGKRACLWIQSLIYDLADVQAQIKKLKFRGVKGTTGTQASFQILFDDYQKVQELDRLVTKKAGFSQKQTLSSQTYDRKQDLDVLNVLAQIGVSFHKITNDFRLLAHLKEIEEPFGKHQIGSSAMAYKRNPMKSERVSSLAKFVISLSQNGSMVAMTQWFERTLDDSANKRLSIPQAFLAIDGAIDLMRDIFDGAVVYEKTISNHIEKELPFMITEFLMMKVVEKGGDRQEIHEKIRELSMQAAFNVKMKGEQNNLIELIEQDSSFALIKDEIKDLLNPLLHIGYSVEQVNDFIANDVQNALSIYQDKLSNQREEISK